MHKAQANSLSNSSTPVNNKTYSANYKSRGFGSKDPNSQVILS